MRERWTSEQAEAKSVFEYAVEFVLVVVIAAAWILIFAAMGE